MNSAEKKHQEISKVFEEFTKQVCDIIAPEEKLSIRVYIHNCPASFFTIDAQVLTSENKKCLIEDITDRFTLVSKNIE